MNVNLLQNNPDWKWYLLFGGLSLILTGALWMGSKLFPVRTTVLNYWSGMLISLQKQITQAPNKPSHKNMASSSSPSNMC
jgi:hypothetical protein